MKNKTKVLGLLLAAILLVSTTVLGTMAYLTDTQEVKNTFTVGNVAITLDEAVIDANGAATATRTTQGNEYHLLPGHTYDKDPTVTVKEGSEESYIRMIVTVNEKADLDAIGVDIATVFQGYDLEKWGTPSETNNVAANTRTYKFRYANTVSAAAGDVKLEPLFTSIVIPGDITNEQLESINDLEINIVAQAIQADGFEDAAAAWAAFDAAE